MKRQTQIIRQANEAIVRARIELSYAAEVASIEGDTYAYALLVGAMRVLGQAGENDELKVQRT